MNTKILIAATVAALSLATTAFAEGEGGRQPLPFNETIAQSYTTEAPDVGSAQYPAANPALSATRLNNAALPEYGAQGEVASANSLPVGALNGTVQYAEAQHMNKWFAQQADRHYAQLVRQTRPNS